MFIDRTATIGSDIMIYRGRLSKTVVVLRYIVDNFDMIVEIGRFPFTPPTKIT